MSAAARPARVLDGATPSYPSARTAWYAVAIFVVTILLAYVDKQIISVLVEPIKHSLAISDTRIGLLQGVAFSLLAAFAAVPLGIAVDRTNRVRMLIGCVLLWSTMTILCGFAGSFWTLFACRVGVGLGEAAIMPLLYSLLADLFPRERRGTAMLIFYLAVVVCASLSVTLAGAALGWLGTHAIPSPLGTFEPWRLAFVLVGLPGPVIALVIALTLGEPSRQEQLAPGGVASFRKSAQYVAEHRGAFGRLVFGSAVALAAGNAVNAWYPTLLVRGFDLAPSRAGIDFGLAAAASALLAVPAAIMLERRAARIGAESLPRLLLLGVSLAAVMTVLVPVAASTPVALGLAGGQLFGLYWIVALTPVLIQQIAPNELRGQVMAIGTLLSTILQGLSPLFVGLYSDLVFTGPNALALSLSATAFPLLATAALLYLRLPAEYRRARARMPRATVA